MDAWENLQLVVALVLAVTAAVASGGNGAAAAMSGFLAEALRPQVADFGGDPGYLLGTEVSDAALARGDALQEVAL